MKPLPENPGNDPLEHAIRRVVAGLPARRAPSTLEARVLAAIASGESRSRAARGFAAWPAPARWLTLPVLAGVAAGVVLVTGSGPGGELLSRLGLSSDVRAAWEALCAGSQALTGVLAMLVRTVPSSWWYTAVLGCAVWYAGVVALGLTAYRLLRTRD